MRYVRYASIGVFAIALVLLALANRQMVSVQVLPDELAGLAALNPRMEVPLFVVIFGGVVAGLVIGFIWEWIREAKERAAAARQAREMRALRAEVKRLKGERNEGKDEVLAILDEAS
ncbi:lipopolysaccharide assembly protein LapA domain-containing protein [Roseovarius salinarum]|uniref:lipopolysaccharide assembly protein LapA domain-containing protein n=1 Tax=Roseovarius salinarum TaxID=1981892 RepID=UPI000C336A85|nr:lipopolysaccharide assembly protein LapA domain-containing protein [Roseovarius salinarum]